MEHRETVNRHRDELKALAILWVVYFHSPLALPGGWDLVRQMGYGGVDLFFFLMGMGLYQSLKRNGDLRAYASRRLWRILPAYLPVLLVWMAVMYPGYGLSTVQAIRGVAGNLTMTGYWLDTPKVFNWFANGQFLFILLAPLCFAVLTCSARRGRALLLLLALAGVVGLANIGLNQMMGASRLPVFLLGMAFAMDWPPVRKPGVVRAAYGAAFLLGLTVLVLCLTRYRELLNDYGLYWYPFALMTPGLCVGIAWLLDKAKRAASLLTPLRWIGRSSFEIYLLNIWSVELAKQAGLTDPGLWALLCVGDVLLGIAYHWLVARGTAALQQAVAARAAAREGTPCA
ncbi:MAG: acyltransferase [Candidatus Limiplasma sp.]|nr:acyltransferase [Candidatus Limiplasma sp.]